MSFKRLTRWPCATFSGLQNTFAHVWNRLLGYAHFGTGPGTVGTEIIDDIAVGGGSATFTPPLGAGTYTGWMQQAGSAATWQMDFVVVPEPGYASLLLLGLPWMARRRR